MSNHLTVLYPPPTLYDEKNSSIWAGGPGNLVKHRTLDTLAEADWTIQTVRFGEPFVPSALPKHTKIWCLGADWLKAVIGDPALNKHRGYRLELLGRPMIATYTPIDCWSFKILDEDEDSDEGGDDSKDVGVTRRANYLFWNLSDFAKLLRPVRPIRTYESRPFVDPLVAAEWLLHAPGNLTVYLDIETRVNDHVLDCIGFGWYRPSTGSLFCFTVPIYVGDKLAGTSAEMARFWRALYHLFRRPDITIVGHNLSFDLSILCHYYNLPIPRKIEDTMLFMHRHHPGVDKSLSHAISYYTDAKRNHKGDFVVNTGRSSFDRLAAYNCEDIHWTAEVHLAQKEIAATNPALASSVDIANKMQVMALRMSLTGILVDIRVRDTKKAKLELKLKGLKRIIAVLLGREDFNPNSPKQCADFFFKELDYPVLEQTEAGAPKLDTKTLYKLQLKQNNPLIPLIILYRETQKECSMLSFEPYERSKGNL